MERSVPCPSCQQVFTAQTGGADLAEYLICAHCNHRFLFDPLAHTDGPVDGAPPASTVLEPRLHVPEGTSTDPGRQHLEAPPGQDARLTRDEPLAPSPYDPGDLPPPPSWPPVGDEAGGEGHDPDEGFDWGSGQEPEPHGGAGDEYVMLFPTTVRPMWAGILLLLAAFIAIGWQVYMQESFTHERADDMAAYYNDRLDTDVEGDFLYDTMHKAVILFTLMAVIAMVGAVMALLRSSYPIARAGAVAGLFSMGPFLVSSLIAMIGLWLIITSRSEFESEAHDTPSLGHYGE